MIWWHKIVKRHIVIRVKVSVPMFDMGAKGYLYKCTCGKDWAK